MDLARLVVEAAVQQGRSYREVARAHGVSKSWVAKLVKRFKEGGYEALQPRSKVAHTIPNRTPPEVEAQIIFLRKDLIDRGFDAGAETIHHHMSLTGDHVPSVTTIWRVLRRRGFVTPQPHKRPRSSWIRFEAQLPNECWQSDVTMWKLVDQSSVEIVNFIDDHSRLVLASKVFRTTTALDVLGVFRAAGKKWGLPAALLTDNGCVYTSWHRGGPNVMQAELMAKGIAFKHSRPYHPQTCGKVERFHQTLKGFLSKQPKARSISELQRQIDRFVAYYNEVRPHRARQRQTPRAAFHARDKARPMGQPIQVGAGVRVREDRVNKSGNVTLRYRSKLHHIGIGKDHIGKRVFMLIDDLDIRVLFENGDVLRRLTLDPSKDYQGTGLPPGPPKGRYAGIDFRKASTMR